MKTHAQHPRYKKMTLCGRGKIVADIPTCKDCLMLTGLALDGRPSFFSSWGFAFPADWANAAERMRDAMSIPDKPPDDW